MPFDEQEALELIEEVEHRYGEDTDRIEKRRHHWHADAAVDPLLPKPYELKYPFQSDMIRQKGTQLISRLTENHFKLNGTGHPQKRDASTTQTSADKAAQYLQLVLQQKEQALGYTVQHALSVGQARDKYGVLHWLKADDLLPPVPERVVQEERDLEIARAGGPWYIECPDPIGFMPVPDRSNKPGYGIVVVRRRVATLRYIEDRKGDATAEMGVPRVMGRERDAPHEGDPSISGWRKVEDMYQIWDRTRWTEVLRDGKKIEQFAGDKHVYGMPPFAIAPAIYNHHPDPVYAYEPAMQGLYRLKENVDYAMALFFAAAEWGMLPYWYMESVSDGTPMLTGDDGQLLIFDRQNIASAKIPKGYTLKPLTHEISESFVRGLDILLKEYQEAAPSTGRASFESSAPQPWSVRLEQAQESVEPGMYMDAQRNCIQTMVDNMTMIHAREKVEDGGFGEPLSMFGRDDRGREDQTKLVTVEARDFRRSAITVDISNVSSSEQIADIQFMKDLLDDPLVPITPRFFLDNGMHLERADEVLAEYDEYRIFEDHLKVPAARQIIRSKIGHIVRLGTDGNLIGAEGQDVAAQDALAAAGFGVQGQEPPGGSPATQGMNGQSQEGGRPLAPLQTPGTRTLPGMPG